MVERRASGPLRRQRVEANISGEKRCDSRAEQGEGKSDAIAMMNRRRESAGDVDTHVRFDGAGARREEHRRVVLIVALDDQQRGERGGRDASAAVGRALHRLPFVVASTWPLSGPVPFAAMAISGRKLL